MRESDPGECTKTTCKRADKNEATKISSFQFIQSLPFYKKTAK